MAKIPGADFIKRVVELFREDADTPVSPAQDPSTSKSRSRLKGHSTNLSAQSHPSEKARESNIDRYKHPSDFSRTGY